MRICLLSESARHPVLDDALDRLAERHRVTVCNPDALPASPRDIDADVYLLKSRSGAAMRIARAAEQDGALVLNGTAATARCRDRLATATGFADRAVPAPRTWAFGSLAGLAEADHLHQALPWPVVVKSRYSRRGDLVRLVRARDDLVGLVPDWHAEPVVVQEFAVNDAWDVKVWVIGGAVRAARRPSALHGRDTSRDVRVPAADLPAEWVRAALSAGSAIGLELFGVDLVISDGRPLVVDVNAFPGFRSAESAAAAVATYVERLAAGRRACA